MPGPPPSIWRLFTPGIGASDMESPSMPCISQAPATPLWMCSAGPSTPITNGSYMTTCSAQSFRRGVHPSGTSLQPPQISPLLLHRSPQARLPSLSKDHQTPLHLHTHPLAPISPAQDVVRSSNNHSRVPFLAPPILVYKSPPPLHFPHQSSHPGAWPSATPQPELAPPNSLAFGCGLAHM